MRVGSHYFKRDTKAFAFGVVVMQEVRRKG